MVLGPKQADRGDLMNTEISHPAFEARIQYTIPNRFDFNLSLISDTPITALYGPSGAGKSTLLKLIAGWTSSNATVVRLAGADISKNKAGKPLPMCGRGVGMVFQDDLLFPHLDVRTNVEFSSRFGLNRNAISKAEMQSLVDSFGIGHLLARRVENLSGGERQRVGLVRALAARPRLLLCDEPVSAIDRSGRAAILEHLKAWVESHSIVMIMVTHDVDEIRRTAGHVWQLDAGQLIAQGPPSILPFELRSKMRTFD